MTTMTLTASSMRMRTATSCETGTTLVKTAQARDRLLTLRGDRFPEGASVLGRIAPSLYFRSRRESAGCQI
jgi:hypothetical protein